MYSDPQPPKTFDFSDATLKLYECASLGPSALTEVLASLLSSRALNYKEQSIEWRQALSRNATFLNICDIDRAASSNEWQLVLDEPFSYLCIPLDHKVELVLSSEESELSKLTENSALSNLLHHIGQALVLCHRVSRQRQESQAVNEVLDHYPIPTLAVDNQLNTIFANKMARQKFLHSQAIEAENRVDHLHAQAREHVDVLKLCDSNSQRLALKNELRKCIFPLQTENCLHRISVNKVDCPLIISPSDSVPDIFKHYARSAVAWVYILDASYSEHLRINPFFLQLELSKAERELCVLLFEGKLLSEIALLRRVSEQTVRKQLQSILRKSNLESQEALIIFLFENCIECKLVK